MHLRTNGMKDSKTDLLIADCLLWSLPFVLIWGYLCQR